MSSKENIINNKKTPSKKIDYSILYVEDDEDVREAFTIKLQRMAKEVFIAKDGAEGLELFKEHKPDIVVSDITMPKLNGIDMAKAMREIEPEQSIIFITGNVDSKYFLESIELQVDGYIVKPIDASQFKSVLKRTVTKLDSQKMSERIKEIHDYAHNQQVRARDKQLHMIVNQLENDWEFEVDVVYEASDILSGDSYSVFKKSDGTIVLFLIDGQGHGIIPSLTVFAAISAVKQAVNYTDTLKKLANRFIEDVVEILGDNEQLSFTIAQINPERNRLDYAIGGMYPFMFRDNGENYSVKTNNLPLTNYSEELEITTVELKSFENLLLCTDGYSEDRTGFSEKFSIASVLKDNTLFKPLKEEIESTELHDDTTILLLKKKSS